MQQTLLKDIFKRKNKMNMEINVNPTSIREIIAEYKDDIASLMLDEFENKFDEVFEDRFDDKLSETITEKVIEAYEDKFDDRIEDKIENYLNYNYDAKSVVEDVLNEIDLEDYFDVDQVDFTDVAKKLLKQYDPDIACSTGLAFTNAVSTAIHHLLNYDSELALAIKESIDKAMQMQIEAIKQEAISSYKDQLEKYFSSVSIATNSTSNNPFETTNVVFNTTNQY
jgi:hypothetical protein